MKAIVTSKRLVSILALMLAIVMCFSACGNNGDTPSDAASADETVDTNVEQTDDNQESSSEAEETNDASSKEEKDTSSKQQQQNTNNQSSKTQQTTNNKSSNTQQTVDTQQSAGSTTWAKDYLSTMPKSVKDKGLTILMWREMHPTEQKLLDDFVKKTGCKVKKVITTEKEYSTKLVSMISAKESPDVCLVQAENFPGIVTKSMQPLDEKVFRLDDKCWNKQYMDAYTINGKYFAVAMPTSWSCEDCLYVTYYLPKVLKECGVSTMPWQLYKQGKWNWAAQNDIAKKVAGAGKGYYGISLQSWDLYMLSAGEDFTTYNGKSFTNKLTKPSSLLTKSWQEVAKLNESGVAVGWKLDQVLQGKIGLFTSIAYGMYNEGDWGYENIPGGFSSLECVPVAGQTQSSAKTPARPKTWGTPKGAKNPEGAAYFLRYWLDVNNCDFDKTYINKQAKEVFEIISKSSHKKQLRLGAGVTNYVTAGQYENICGSLVTSSTNVPTILASKKGMVQTGVDRANRDLTRIR